MRLRYGLYLLGLFLIFLVLFEIRTFGRMKEDLSSRQRELLRMRGEILKKSERMDRLKALIKKEGIPLLSRGEALRVVMSELERLRDTFETLNIRRDVRAEGNLWRVEVELSFRPKSGEDLVAKLKRLTNRKRPVLQISRVEVDQSGEETRVRVFLSVLQPFTEVKR
jgi:uncharacterized protein YxjI